MKSDSGTSATARQQAIFRRLNEIAALSHLPLVEQFRRALAVGAEHLGLEFGIVSRVEGEIYEVLSQVSPPETLSDGQTFPFSITYCSITLAQDGVLAIDNMALSPYLGHPCYEAFKLNAYIGAPTSVEGRPYGTVNFSSPFPYHRKFDEIDREFVDQLARWASSAIERDRALLRLAKSEERLRTILETEPECVKILAPDLTLRQMNRAGLDMIEADAPDQVVGRCILDVVAPEYQESFRAYHERIARGGSGTLAFEIAGLKGGRRWLETHAVPLRDSTGNVMELLAVTRDITERRRAEAGLLEATRSAETANMAKSAFLAMMSHEIRTPLNGVLGMAQLLMQDGVTDTERREYARTILDSGNILLTLLNDILDLAKVESGKMELSPSVFSPSRLVAEIADLFRHAAEAKGVAFDTRWSGVGHACYRGDARRLRQMLSNLTSNAIKFTERGSITLTASEVGQDETGVLLRFEVSDTGIGVPREAQARLFQPFTQAHGAISQQHGGTGLGLSIVRSLALLMGGEVGVNSEPGLGASFWFTVRVAPASS